jgi:hypothetical protein
MAFLVPKLVGLREELNDLCPNRAKHSDGWIGDQNHQQYTSGHNPDESGEAEFQDADTADEVRAVDLDKDLNRPGLTMGAVADFLRLKCKSGHINWIHYIIWNRQICSANSGWNWSPYTGANAHTEHMHISGNLRADSGPYTKVGLASLVEDDMLTEAEAQKLQFVHYRVAAMMANSPTVTIPKIGDMTGDFTHENKLATFLNGLNARLSTLEAQILNVDEETLAKFGNSDIDVSDKAELLRIALGDDAVEVGQLLANP